MFHEASSFDNTQDIFIFQGRSKNQAGSREIKNHKKKEKKPFQGRHNGSIR